MHLISRDFKAALSDAVWSLESKFRLHASWLSCQEVEGLVVVVTAERPLSRDAVSMFVSKKQLDNFHFGFRPFPTVVAATKLGILDRKLEQFTAKNWVFVDSDVRTIFGHVCCDWTKWTDLSLTLTRSFFCLNLTRSNWKLTWSCNIFNLQIQHISGLQKRTVPTFILVTG